MLTKTTNLIVLTIALLVLDLCMIGGSLPNVPVVGYLGSLMVRYLHTPTWSIDWWPKPVQQAYRVCVFVVLPICIAYVGYRAHKTHTNPNYYYDMTMYSVCDRIKKERNLGTQMKDIVDDIQQRWSRRQTRLTEDAFVSLCPNVTND